MVRQQKNRWNSSGFFVQDGAPTGIRTPVVALKGPRPRPLDDGGLFLEWANSIIPSNVSQAILRLNFRLHPLINQGHDIDHISINQDTGALNTQIWNEDRGQCGVHNR